MRAIWKFVVPVEDRMRIVMPRGSKLLAFQSQNDELCLWAEVDTKSRLDDERTFAVFGTGNPMPREMGYSDVYIGTAQIGHFVWHLYELTGV